MRLTSKTYEKTHVCHRGSGVSTLPVRHILSLYGSIFVVGNSLVWSVVFFNHFGKNNRSPSFHLSDSVFGYSLND